ncbi:serine hydrolase domain-containing protein [Rhodopseudomonas palustris]|uniref:6-aminohexanoate-dimer hydrolase n=1 Tax=Rhodopseudomonas palustris (strain ATCC BAA-98 / CGA009) TaxID=258594 RepID=Q6N8M5_RHOPA|nr:serine hydrolase [Rhodopseudomonas palustris]OPF94124.1 6-aminohexanoate hydrolase [Rhodopseudomonas palustris]PPQ43648.1 6-aminohexanoate hydrolase [Rhodopseudomonas palustris]QQM03384.1 6-aminohexanoate-dimer hydrolase [Rhodopseudomonas palustris]RJF62614.1 class C beta-lactamase-related serine hydrolase [Rhodopseudomonas palustris]WAB79542.1 serine hydrolase [Rhodopseudomonas palustris]
MSPSDLAAPEDASGATLANWRELPFSRWSFRNIDALIPTEAIANAPDDIWSLPAAPRALNDFRVRAQGGGILDLEGFLAATDTDALVVLKDGRIAIEAYANGTTAATPHIIMSASKSITGLIAGILSERGHLQLDAEVTKLIPEVADTAYQGATLRQMLDMRTGIQIDPDAQRAYAAAAGWDTVPEDLPPTDLKTFYRGFTIKPQPHGGAFRYVSANTDLLGWAIERATGTRFTTLVSDLLWQPLGAEQPASITTDRQGQARATGGFSMVARDFARIGQMILDDGYRDGRTIVPPSWIDDLWTAGDRDAWRLGEWQKLFPYRNFSYRGGWYVIHDEPKTMFAMGIHGQNLFIDPENRLVIAKLSSQGAAVDNAAWAVTHRALPEFRRCLAS